MPFFYHNSCIRQSLNVNDYPVCVPIRKRRNGATNIEKINQLGVPSRADNRYRKIGHRPLLFCFYGIGKKKEVVHLFSMLL